jgi:hypothetical protein
LLSNNCRDVAEAIARALSRKAQDVTVSKALENEWSLRQIKMGWMVPPFGGTGLFQPFEGYVPDNYVPAQTVIGSVFSQIHRKVRGIYIKLQAEQPQTAKPQ